MNKKGIVLTDSNEMHNNFKKFSTPRLKVINKSIQQLNSDKLKTLTETKEIKMKNRLTSRNNIYDTTKSNSLDVEKHIPLLNRISSNRKVQFFDKNSQYLNATPKSFKINLLLKNNSNSDPDSKVNCIMINKSVPTIKKKFNFNSKLINNMEIDENEEISRDQKFKYKTENQTKFDNKFTKYANSNYHIVDISMYKNILQSNVSKYITAKFSMKSFGIVKGYGANTNQGLVRNYNEDRVSIILNVVKPETGLNENWPKVSFFGIYDGHGGNACADFLKDNLHQYVRIFSKLTRFFEKKVSRLTQHPQFTTGSKRPKKDFLKNTSQSTFYLITTDLAHVLSLL
jgi:hypothetical protein